jgi:hypothetical protein
MSERKLFSEFLSNKQKKLLRDYYNSENGTAIDNINRITQRMGMQSSQETYELLRDLYNSDVEIRRRRQKRLKYQLKKELQRTEQLGELVTPVTPRTKKPTMTLNKLFGYVKHWLKGKEGHFEITLKSRIADIRRNFKFNHLLHLENWIKKLINEHEVDSAGNVVENDKYDLFKDVIVDNIKMVSGGCSTREKKMELKSTFYKYKLYSPSSHDNNCFFACLRHMTGLTNTYHNLRKQFSLPSKTEISITDAYKIIKHLGYDIQIIDYDTNEELEDRKYIVYKDSHYYVLESFEQIILKDKKTKRGLLTFDLETRKTEQYDVIKATGESLYILKDSLCCVYYRKYKKQECDNITFVTGEKSSSRQFIDWLNCESSNGRTYNVIAHNGGRFDFYFVISSMTDRELLECNLHFRGTTIISINYRGHLFKDSACFLTESLKNLSKSFKVSDGKITEFDLHGKKITSEQLCFYRPELTFDSFMNLQVYDNEFWELYVKYCLYDCISLFQIWEKFTDCVNTLIEKINPHLLGTCKLASSTTIGSHSKKIVSEINKYNGKINKWKKLMEQFTGIDYVKNDDIWVKQIDYDKYKFLCNFKRGGISHCNMMGKHMGGITGVDIASQYPASLIYAMIPVGKSYWIDYYDELKYGFYQLKNLVFNSYKLKPVALGSDILNWATNNINELYVDSYMLKYIITNYGLIQFDVEKALVSDMEIPARNLFGTYIETFYEEKKLQDKLKTENSSQYNEALRSTIKLYLNSLTGKLVENPAIHFSTKFDEHSSVSLNGIGITRTKNDDKINEWIVSGIMVYSYSKRLLFEYIKCLPNNSNDVVHIETDGIYFSTQHLDKFTDNLNNYQGEYPCKFGDDLGNLKIEKSTPAGQVAYFLGKKFYCITMNDDYNNRARDEKDKNIYRVKGIPQKTINFDGSGKWLVDVKLYEDVFNGVTVTKRFQALKKSLFCENTRITSYEMKREIKSDKSKFSIYK